MPLSQFPLCQGPSSSSATRLIFPFPSRPLPFVPPLCLFAAPPRWSITTACIAVYSGAGEQLRALIINCVLYGVDGLNCNDRKCCFFPPLKWKRMKGLCWNLACCFSVLLSLSAAGHPRPSPWLRSLQTSVHSVASRRTADASGRITAATV